MLCWIYFSGPPNFLKIILNIIFCILDSGAMKWFLWCVAFYIPEDNIIVKKKYVLNYSSVVSGIKLDLVSTREERWVKRKLLATL